MGSSLIVKLLLPESMGGPKRLKRESSTAPAEPPSRRLVRSTRTQISTYNNAILAGTALHTPTKYLEKHHKNVLHGPLVTMAPTFSHKRKSGPGPSALQQNITPTFEDAGQGKIRGSRGVFVKKTKEIAAAVAAASPIPNATEPSPSITAPVNSKPPLPSYGDSSTSQPGVAAYPNHNAAEPTQAITAPMNGKPSLTEYWDKQTWQRFTKTAVITLSKVVHCLGLKPTNRKANVVFPRPVQQSLSNDIDAIATKLYAQLPTEELVSCAADSNYLEEELDVILDTYAPDIWSMDTDRRQMQMLELREESVYKKDLIYGDDDDRKLLWLHLHRWIFVRAFQLLRKQDGDEDARKGVLEALVQQGDASTAPVEEEPRTGRKRKAPEETNTPRKRKAPVTSDHLTIAFLEYLNGFGKSGFMPDRSLKHLKRALYKVATSLPRLLASQPAAESFVHILVAWITYQQSLLDVLTSHGLTSDLKLSPITLKIKNSRLLTELRQARNGFITCGTQAERVLVKGFGALQSTVAEAQKVRSEIGDRFRRLDKGLVKLGNELQEGGGKWVLMGPSQCPIVLMKREAW